MVMVMAVVLVLVVVEGRGLEVLKRLYTAEILKQFINLYLIIQIVKLLQSTATNVIIVALTD